MVMPAALARSVREATKPPKLEAWDIPARSSLYQGLARSLRSTPSIQLHLHSLQGQAMDSCTTCTVDIRPFVLRPMNTDKWRQVSTTRSRSQEYIQATSADRAARPRWVPQQVSSYYADPSRLIAASIQAHSSKSYYRTF
jgi:hypothetical protein